MLFNFISLIKKHMTQNVSYSNFQIWLLITKQKCIFMFLYKKNKCAFLLMFRFALKYTYVIIPVKFKIIFLL